MPPRTTVSSDGPLKLLEVRKSLGARIHGLRQSSKCSEEGFCQACHISPEYLRMIERGECNVTLGILARTARQLNTTVSALFDGIA